MLSTAPVINTEDWRLRGRAAGLRAGTEGARSHGLRNEGDVPLVNVVVQLVPSGVARTIRVPDPGNCSF